MPKIYVARVRDQFSKEDFFVWVEGVDDERHQLGDFRLERERLHIGRGLFGVRHNSARKQYLPIKKSIAGLRAMVVLIVQKAALRKTTRKQNT